MTLQKLFYGKVRVIHFVGIGGIGMSGIALVLYKLGFDVQGSDIAEGSTTAQLKNDGITVFVGHHTSHIQNADVVVISGMVPLDNPEVVAAHEKGIPVIPRSKMLAELMRLRYGIAIAGTHGKTTTTSLVAAVLQKAALDPTVIIGGKVNHLGSNAVLGTGEFIVAEADESDGSFKHLSPSIVALTNIDSDHLDFWQGGIEEIKTAFVEFINKLPFFGLIVLSLESEHNRAIIPRINRRIKTYSLNHDADFKAVHIKHDHLCTHFTVLFQNKVLGEITLKLVGDHNVENALAAIAIGDELGVDFETIKEGLESFSGVQRRFSLIGFENDVYVIDDYAHHPTEINAVLKAAKLTFKNRRIIALFQPHRYSRTKIVLNDFEHAFNSADELVISDIYAAGESNTFDVTVHDVVNVVKKARSAKYVPYDALVHHVQQILQPGDVVLTLGAGNITHIAPKIVQAIKGGCA